MQGLLQLCRQEGIDVEYCALTRRKSILGWYIPDMDGERVILLDESLLTKPRLERCVLAEELGHHFALQVSGLSVAYGLHHAALQRRNRRQNEARAVRWAANYLIPSAALADAIRSGLRRVDEFADYFYVTEWMVWRKIRALETDLKEQQALRIKGWRSLLSPLLVDAMWGQAV